MMANLEAFSWAWLSILIAVQNVVFMLMLMSNDEMSISKNYVASWAKTFRMLKRLFIVVDSARDRKDWLIALGWMALCLPGAILVFGTLSRMVG